MGQLLFTGRFLIQWFASEKQGRSVIPTAFWYCSIGGGMTLLAYAVYRRDPVFILGQSTGLLIYVRNLQMILREQRLLLKSQTVLVPQTDAAATTPPVPAVPTPAAPPSALKLRQSA
ncbi:MAG: lipid-A-disaccharide synthase N-terminal domain-containing protein [Planctomycetaceae bacterium]|nr:lipid-A-disaccharide synthase N-terminal domain-containing protein [Planctomycetaceae bacterium]